MNRKLFTVVALLLVIGVGFCSCQLMPEVTSSEVSTPPETVIVKETVFVTESKPTESEETSRTESTAREESRLSDSVSESEEQQEKMGYTTSELLAKAAKDADKQYWIVYYAGNRNNRVEMTSFIALEDFSVKWNDKLICEKQVGKCTRYKFDEEKNAFVSMNTYSDLADSATGIIGSNCDITDVKSEKTISAKTE